ncbi:MAG: GNAT family N-acetyltransferase [Actinomycetota bacterium]
MLITDHVYPQPELPHDIEIQVLAFMRIVWSDVFSNGENRFRERLHESPGAVHFVRSAGALLVSHVKVQPVEARAGDHLLRIAAVGGVMTYPQFRGEGHATALLRRAADHAGSFDIGMLFCDPETVAFYERLEWRVLAPGRVMVKGAAPEHDRIMVLGESSVLPPALQVDRSW